MQTTRSVKFIISLLIVGSASVVHAQFSEEEQEKGLLAAIRMGAIKIDTPDKAACREVDLNKSPKSPFRRIPIYDQDGSGNCYAYVAAQMIDYYQMSKGISTGITNPSAAAWAYKYKAVSFLKDDSLNSGDVRDTLVAVKKVGVCSDKETKARLARFKKAGGLTEPELFAFLDTIYENHGSYLFRKDWNRTSEQAAEKIGRACNQSNGLRDLLKKEDLFAIPTTEVLNQLFKGCKMNSIKTPDLRVVDGDNKEISAALKSSFKRGLPVAASVCSDAFDDSGYKGIKSESPLVFERGHKFNRNKGCETKHAVMFTAQISINGGCRYLVRNTWGADWKPKDGLCSCITKTGEYKQLCVHSEAKEILGCWYDEDHLLNNTGDVSVFK